MGIFSLSSDGNWNKSINLIIYNFGILRESWYKMVINNFLLKAKAEGIDIETDNTEFQKENEHPIKALQLVLLYMFITDHEYINSSELARFMDKVYIELRDYPSTEIEDYYRKYVDKNDIESVLKEFAFDLALTIVTEENVLTASLVIAFAVPMLILQTHLIIAKIFNDKYTAQKVNRLISSL